jgi:hypothetical protein
MMLFHHKVVITLKNYRFNLTKRGLLNLPLLLKAEKFR